MSAYWHDHPGDWADDCPSCAKDRTGMRRSLSVPTGAVLLRDTPEDRERLAAALPDDIWKHDGYGGNGEQLADAIIAALRGRNAGFYDDPNAEGNDR